MTETRQFIIFLLVIFTAITNYSMTRSIVNIEKALQSIEGKLK